MEIFVLVFQITCATVLLFLLVYAKIEDFKGNMRGDYQKMTETKFTPGPWEAHINDNGCIYVTSDFATKGDICDLYHKGTDGKIYSKENAEADAHLIACAPDMYAMLERVQERLTPKGNLYHEINDLLKKARGEA